MANSPQLWKSYHDAVQAGNISLAKRILQSLQSYKGNPPPPTGGCSKCKRRIH